MMYTCVICGDDLEGVAPKTINGLKLCGECIEERIIPLFHEALKYETKYPAQLGDGNALDPKDFIEYFDGSKADFIKQWGKKKREYDTAPTSRFYCPCSNFLCAKPKHGLMKSFGVHCVECGHTVCFPCGANLDAETGNEHVCPPYAWVKEDPMKRFKGLERGRDYQLCPNTDCETSVQLQDGCNHLTCKACGTNFCYICGDKAVAESGHWSLGKPCPRWNHPNDANAGFDIGNLHAHPAPGFEERNLAERAARAFHEEERWQSIDMLFDSLGREEYNRRIAEATDLLDELPDLPDLTGMTIEAQLAAENALAPELEASPLGRFMLQSQHELDTMIGLAHTHLQEAEDEDLARPPWAVQAVELMTHLRHNLDLYVYRVRLRVHFEIFDARHDALEIHGGHQAEIFRHFPRFYEILVAYAAVAETRFRVATQEAEAAAGPTLRQQLAEMEHDRVELDRATARAKQLIAEATRNIEMRRQVPEVEESLRRAQEAVEAANGLRRAHIMQAARLWLEVMRQGGEAAAEEERE